MPTGSPVVLGVDPGSRTTGFGVIQEEGSRLIHIRSGSLKTLEKEPFEQRLLSIHEGLLHIIRETLPSVMAVETPFYAKNVRSAFILAHARSAALLAGAYMKIPIVEYSPMEVKRATVGYGRAEKGQVAEMIVRLFRLPKYGALPSHDASDALAVALCHLHSMRTRGRMALGREVIHHTEVRE